jgi:hypothetical protein
MFSLALLYTLPQDNSNGFAYAIMSSSSHSPPWMDKFVAQYFQLVGLRDLYHSLPASQVLKDPYMQTLLYQRLFDETAIFPKPPVTYRLRVLKEILSRIESAFSDPERDVRSFKLSF